MNLQRSAKVWCVLIAGVLTCQLSCNSNPASSPSDNLIVKIIDAPAAFDQEVIVIRRIDLHRAGSAAELDWRVINGNVTTYDLLKFRNGVSQVAVSTYVPTGSYDAIRLTLEGSYVWIGGKYVLLDLPANVAGGFVISYPLVVADQNVYQLILDFDAYRSVRQTSATTYELYPVVRVQDAAIAGAIAGAVISADSSKPANCVISSNVGADEVGTTPDPSNGSFLLGALPEGTYSMRITSPDSVFKDTTVSAIRVLRLQQTSIGVIGLLRR